MPPSDVAISGCRSSQPRGEGRRGRQALQEISEELIAAFAIISMVGPAKEGAELGLRHPQTGPLQEGDDVAVLELEGRPEPFQNGVVGDRNLDGLGRSALVL